MLHLLRKIKSYFHKNIEIDKDINYYLNSNYQIHPYSESIKIALIYGVVGTLWILLSDEFLSTIVSNVDAYKELATYKGWAYVFITMILIYSLVLKRLVLFEKAIKKIYSNFEDLNAANEESIALEEELRQQFDELEIHRNALIVSEQRYELAVEGADCGIWDWDIKNGIHYVSPKWKTYLGYCENELDNNFDTWANLLHPDEKESVISKVDNYILSKTGSYENVYRMLCKDGNYKWILSKGKAIWNSEGKAIRLAGSFTDISEHKHIEDRLNLLAYYDTLTELPNRVLFEIKVKELIYEKNKSNTKFALIYMDIDNFKHINDTLGHMSGDLFLKYISDILKSQVKIPDFAARLSGDEFAIIIENINDKNDVINRIQILLKHLRKPWMLDNHEFFISFSIGVAIYPEHGDTLSLLLKNSDIAMYYVKKNMKDDYCFYSHDIQAENVKQIIMINELRHAIDNEEFALVYQPIINLNSGKLIGVESLIRWIDPIKGVISPMEFIPLAEETGLIHEIGKWVLKTALFQKKTWEEQGYPHIKMSVNISGKRVTNSDLINEVRELILKTNLNSNEIQLEVTETAVMEDINTSTRVLKELRDMGVKIALDDFGTGYSSLTYLERLPIDIVKLDRNFIKGISNVGQSNVIVESVIKLTHDLNLGIVAEGIETKNQLEFLILNNCDYGQGYLFSKPVTEKEIEKLLLENLIYV
ncbi:sensor domain-containing protein [Clostridium magnum]|nr:GGDEF domain-containing phosphodiesterase [Clostridium magnum]